MKPTVGAALIAVVSRSSGLGGGAAARPPRPARPARPAGAAGAALGGAGGGAASAARRGARSTSVDHRNNSIVIGTAGAPAPIMLTLSFSAAAGAAPPSANVRPALTMTSIATAVTTPATSVRLLPLTVVGALGPAEPLDQSLEFFVFEFRAALAHVHRDDTPSLGREAGTVHPVDAMARCACALHQRLAFSVGEERRDFRRH